MNHPPLVFPEPGDNETAHQYRTRTWPAVVEQYETVFDTMLKTKHQERIDANAAYEAEYERAEKAERLTRIVYEHVLHAMDQCHPKLLAEVAAEYAKPNAQLHEGEVRVALNNVLALYYDDESITDTIDQLGYDAQEARSRTEECESHAERLRDELLSADDLLEHLVDALNKAPVITQE